MTTRKIFKSRLAVVGISLATVVGAQTEPPAGKGAKAEATRAAAKMGPFELAPHYSPYDYPTSVNEGQAFHIVEKGDTLWDIAGDYLGNPFLWPQVWEANGYIKKARLIYPGDPIFLPSPVLVAEAPVAIPEPAVEADTPATTTPKAETVRLQAWADPDALVSPESTESVRNAGYISASVEDESLKIKDIEGDAGSPVAHITAVTRDYLYLNRGASSGIKAGDLYTLHRRARTVSNPVTGKKVGYRIETTGTARILVVSETGSRAVVESSGREIAIGDYLRPLTDVEAPLVKRRVIVDGGDLSLDARPIGYVIDVDNGAIMSATGVLVGLDVGSGTGLAVGKVITVFRQADRNDSLTRRALGAAVVVSVRENFSVARLLYSRQEVLVGDRVMLQP